MSETSMKKIAVIILICSLIQGCATASTSSGFQPSHNREIPPGIPKRVAVLITGETPLDVQASDQFSTGLLEIGFDVMERRQIQAVLAEVQFQQSGLVTEAGAIELGKMLNVQGVFIGSATGGSGPMWVNTHLNIKLVEVKSGKVIWSVSAHDPRNFSWSNDARTSIACTTQSALQFLKNDLQASQ
jgi:PBP1b-binding outer membrane lipoprotein LpoB